MNILDRYFDGVIFDMDDLILDNGSWYKYAYQYAARELGYFISDECYAQLLGIPHAECDKILSKSFGEEFSIEIFNKVLQQQYQETLNKKGVKFRDGFETLFSYLEKQGVSIGLATSSTWKHVEMHLSQTRYLQAFDVICTADQIQRGKPDPEIYTLASRCMNRQPKNIVVFEDSNNGIRSAIAAGCMAIMVPNQALPDEDVKEKALLVLSSLADAIPLMY
ncbi:MAG: HAD family phosphatase [Brasilonema octagenarum HA4186-MV1]|jgi:HAD superfamily hydrolase (TIGR01509 family)|nr:HAD family phosphatase [Brasilonema octagenarum HA4186-MV1]